MQNSIAWRHGIALLATAAAALLVWKWSQIAPPSVPPPPRIMHIQLAPPPVPPPPQPPHPVKEVQAPFVAPRVARLPQSQDSNPTLQAQPAPRQPMLPPPAAPPAPPTPAPITPPVNTASLENAYAAKVYAAVEAQKRYPTSKDARLEQPRGVVGVWLLLSRTGAILDAGIDSSHGSILDRQALQSVRAATYPPFPADAFAGAEQHRFIVQLNFIPP